MKKTILIALICLSFIPAYADENDQTKKNLANNYLAFLREEGFSPILDDDGDVKFKYQGDTQYIRPTINERRLVLLNFFSNISSEKYGKLVRIANSTMAEYYHIRVYVTKRDDGNYNVWFRVDNYLVNKDDFKGVIYRCLSTIQDSMKYFKDEYNKE